MVGLLDRVLRLTNTFCHGPVSSQTFREKLSCFQSGVDIPVAAHYEALMKAFPAAVVRHTHTVHMSPPAQPVSPLTCYCCCMYVGMLGGGAQVVLTRRPSREWAQSALRTICPAAAARGAQFRPSPISPGRTPHFPTAPWYVRVLRAVLPLAPGTEPSAYNAMMVEVTSRIHAVAVSEPIGTPLPGDRAGAVGAACIVGCSLA